MRAGAGRLAAFDLVFVDMDGTFLASDKSIPAGHLRLLDVLGEAGVSVVPCSGRPVSALPRQLLSHPCVRYAVGSNGAVVYDVARSERLCVRALNKERVRELYERVASLEVTFDVFVDGEVLSERARYEAMGSYGIAAPTLEMLRRVRKPVDLLVPQVVAQAQAVEKVTSFWHTPHDREELARAVEAVGGFSCAQGDPKDLELQAEGVSKGSALEWLCAHAGVSRERTVAFGDEANDIPMLVAAGDGVAMRNATPEVRAVADHVTERTNDQAGIAHYLLG